MRTLYRLLRAGMHTALLFVLPWLTGALVGMVFDVREVAETKGRFATIFTITLAVQPPAVAWAFLVPGLIIHTTFGVLSGLVSSPLIRAILVPRAPPVVTPDVMSPEGPEVTRGKP